MAKIVPKTIVVVVFLLVALLMSCNNSNESPVLRINASDTIYTNFGEPFQIPSLVAFDKEDYDLSNLVTMTGNLDVHRLGSYEVLFNVKDSDQNTTSEGRIVTVIPNPSAMVGNFRSSSNCEGCGLEGHTSIYLHPSYTDAITISPSLYGAGGNNDIVLFRSGLSYKLYQRNNLIKCANTNTSYFVEAATITLSPSIDSIFVELKLTSFTTTNFSYCTALYVRE